MTTYRLLFPAFEGQRAAIAERAGLGQIECENCGTGTKPPHTRKLTPMGQGWALRPEFDAGVLLQFADHAAATAWLAGVGAAAAARSLAVEIPSRSRRHCVVVVFWECLPQPPEQGILECENCPPGTKPSWVPAVDPTASANLSRVSTPVGAYVLRFESAEAADAWVASPAGAGYLDGTLSQRLDLPSAPAA